MTIDMYSSEKTMGEKLAEIDKEFNQYIQQKNKPKNSK